jgi:hypothetical protein
MHFTSILPTLPLNLTVNPDFPGLQAGTALANLVENPLALQDFISGCVVAAAVHSKDLEVAAQALAALSALKLAEPTSQAHHELLWHSVAVMVSCTTEHRSGRISSSLTNIRNLVSAVSCTTERRWGRIISFPMTI